MTVTPTPPREQDNKEVMRKLDEIQKALAPLAIITLLTKGLELKVNDLNQRMPTQADLENAAAAGTCRTTQSGGCSAKAMADAADAPTKAADAAKKSADGANKKLDDVLDKLDKAAQAANFALLQQIDKKLGPQITGGVSGGIGRLMSRLDRVSKLVNDRFIKTWNFLQIDRVLNVLTFITALHNAYMLSSNLGQTLFSAIGNVLDVFGIEQSDGSPLNISEMVGKWTEDFAKKLFGIQTVEGIKKEWTQLNRIYQAASNIVWSVQSIFDSTRNLLNIAIENTGKIGNALRKSGAVFENAYGNLVERATARNTWQKRMDDFAAGVSQVETVISTIDSAASEVLSIQSTVKELKNQQKEFNDSVEAFKADTDKKESDSKKASTAPQL
jgi:tetrahydromethanopterin S-methyltransferase subunit G